MDTQEAVARILALRTLTKETGTITTRVQSRILQSLDDATLLEVSWQLAQNKALAVLSGVKPEARDGNSGK